MTNRRPRSPGSFHDELAGVIERISPAHPKPPRKREEPDERGGPNAAALNDRLFERAWWRPRDD